MYVHAPNTWVRRIPEGTTFFLYSIWMYIFLLPEKVRCKIFRMMLLKFWSRLVRNVFLLQKNVRLSPKQSLLLGRPHYKKNVPSMQKCLAS